MTTPTNSGPRVFKIGTSKIVETEAMRSFSNEQIRQMLKGEYPEVANATISERVGPDGARWVEFLPQPGKKG